ncbi:MAG TPA: amidohydrolase family protein [Acidimicrobiales bacterium]
MLDLLLVGGNVVDGTGTPARRGDVGIRGGRIVAVGSTDEPAARRIDVTGLVVAPGFVDIHTHYDAQLLWDPTASPSPLHGVTTVLGGNCGFTIAPLDDDDADYVMRMMARVEGMALSALQSGPSWDWRSFGEWLDQLDGRVAVNAGFLVGHSTIRRLAMGGAAVGEPSTQRDIAAMVALAHDAMSAGALGVSSSLGEAHTDGDGQPVPSRAASPAELLALARAVRDHEGTTLEFIPAMGEIPDDRIELMTDMSLAANRPLNWNLLGSLSPTAIFEQQLSASDRARERGAHVVALTLPDLMRIRANKVLEDMPGWREVTTLPDEQRRRAVADPLVRRRLREGAAEAAARGLGAVASWDLVEIAEAESPATQALVGRTVADIAAERGVDPVEVLLDVVLPERLPLTLVLPSLVPALGASDEGWQIRAAVWKDERTVLGGSDAGAHLDIMCHANYTTAVLGHAVRERGLLSVEEAVRQFTDVPARLYGLRGRGRLAPGWAADVVVFDPDRVGTAPARARFDLPGDNLRLYAEADGIEHVFVNGREIVTGDHFTGESGGTLLRSGRDTETVTVTGG